MRQNPSPVEEKLSAEERQMMSATKHLQSVLHSTSPSSQLLAALQSAHCRPIDAAKDIKLFSFKSAQLNATTGAPDYSAIFSKPFTMDGAPLNFSSSSSSSTSGVQPVAFGSWSATATNPLKEAIIFDPTPAKVSASGTRGFHFKEARRADYNTGSGATPITTHVSDRMVQDQSMTTFDGWDGKSIDEWRLEDYTVLGWNSEGVLPDPNDTVLLDAPLPLTFASPPCVIYLLSSFPSRVAQLSAFGLHWMPITRAFLERQKWWRDQRATAAGEQMEHERTEKQRRESEKNEEEELVEALDSLGETYGSATAPTVENIPLELPPSPFTPDMLPSSESEDADFVTFYSVESALFSAPPAHELQQYQLRMVQLPAAIEANARALEEAESKGELADVGRLYMQRKHLQAEWEAFQREVPPKAELVEIRDTLRLPYGPVYLDGQLYFLLRSHDRALSTSLEQMRRVVIARVHLCGRITNQPRLFVGEKCTTRVSGYSLGNLRKAIFSSPSLSSGFSSLFPSSSPHFRLDRLLYSGKKDGWTGKAFHEKVDGRGPTVGLVRVEYYQAATSISETKSALFGFYVATSFRSEGEPYAGEGGCFLFTFHDAEGTDSGVRKFTARHSGAIYPTPAYGPVFVGPDGAWALSLVGQQARSVCASVGTTGLGFDEKETGQSFAATTLMGVDAATITDFEVYAAEG
jgi:hypothetical protein